MLYLANHNFPLKQLTSTDLLQLSRKETNARKRMRLLVVSYFLDGYNRTEIAKTLKVARASANLWVSAYLSEGISGLDSTPPPGRPPKLSNNQLEQLAQYIDKQSHSTDGGRLTGQDVCDYIHTEFGIGYHSPLCQDSCRLN